MANMKRSRGRPKGTELDDSAVLMRLAEMLTINPNLRVTTAFKKIVHRPDPAYIRRVQAKWMMVGAALIAEVRARMVAPPASRAQTPHSSPKDLMRHVVDSPVLRAMRAFDDTPTMRAIRSIQNDPTMRAMRELRDNPVMRAARAIEDSPALKSMRDLDRDPTMRLIRQIENDPTMRLMREMERDPTMRALREHQNMLRRLGL